MEYLTANKRSVRIIGQYYVNGSVKFTGLPEVWGSASDSLYYIPNTTIPDTNIGWYWTATDSNSTNSTATGSWGGTIDAIPDNSLKITVRSCVVLSCIRDKFLCCRRLARLWHIYHPSSDGSIQLIFVLILSSIGGTKTGTSSCLILIIRKLNKFW